MAFDTFVQFLKDAQAAGAAAAAPEGSPELSAALRRFGEELLKNPARVEKEFRAAGGQHRGALQARPPAPLSASGMHACLLGRPALRRLGSSRRAFCCSERLQLVFTADLTL